MPEASRNAELASILNDPSLTRAERIDRLMKLHDAARAEQRLASEGGSVDDDGLNSNLRDIELALEKLGEDPAAEEGKGPATL